jgi:signal transduction histidine kinase
MIIGRTSSPGRITVLHGMPERGEAVERALRAAGHRVALVPPGPRAIPSAAESLPDLVIASLSFKTPPLASIIGALRQVLGAELPVLVLVAREEQTKLVADDPDELVEADDIIREPVDVGELTLRITGLLRAQRERQRLERRVQELLGLYRISWAFSLAGGAKALYGRLAREGAELFDTERRQMVAEEPAHGITPEQLQRLRYTVDGEPRERWNFRKNGPLLANSPRADSRLLPELIAALGFNSLMIAPMAVGARVHGLLLVADRPHGAPFSEEDLNLLQAVAGQAAVAVQNLQLHEELRRANAQLQAYDRLKSEFVAMVAHDFRKPLMAIRGFAELVLEEDLPLETRREFMQTVITETDALAALANETLLITRIETGDFSFEWSDLDLGPLILNAIPLGLSDHSVLMDVPSGIPRLRADTARLREVLDNLISNAIKYSPGGGTILVRCRQRGSGQVAIEVIDPGLGIPADQLGTLFQKFQRVRTPEHLRIPGTGLGLYICRLIVEGHGGQLWVESEPGKGSIFGFVLPVDAATATANSRRAAGGAGAAPGPAEDAAAAPPLPASDAGVDPAT